MGLVTGDTIKLQLLHEVNEEFRTLSLRQGPQKSPNFQVSNAKLRSNGGLRLRNDNNFMNKAHYLSCSFDISVRVPCTRPVLCTLLPRPPLLAREITGVYPSFGLFVRG